MGRYRAWSGLQATKSSDGNFSAKNLLTEISAFPRWVLVEAVSASGVSRRCSGLFSKTAALSLLWG